MATSPKPQAFSDKSDGLENKAREASHRAFDDSSMKRKLDPASLKALQQVLRHEFSNADVLQLALTHTSARTDKLADYERLEFLGDRVIGLLVCEMLLAQFPREKEGDLAKRLAHLVRKETLAQVARKLNFGCYIRLSRGENSAGGRDNPSLLADVCEALIAALYMDGGLEAARAFVHKHWHDLVLEAQQPPRDAKTTLQEWAQARGLPVPSYRLVSQKGPSHNPVFDIQVLVEDWPAKSGKGSAKRTAEQEAAKALLALIQAEERKARKQEKAERAQKRTQALATKPQDEKVGH